MLWIGNCSTNFMELKKLSVESLVQNFFEHIFHGLIFTYIFLIKLYNNIFRDEILLLIKDLDILLAVECPEEMSSSSKF